MSSPEKIIDIDLSKEMEESFLEYSYSVIYARALPDARDGLKPVHRRIIYQMGEMGLRPERGHVKSARVTGEVMGKLHPHGDTAIYDALVRMSQDFSLRYPLIDGHGNFGSLDDGPAAARYTEARLAQLSMLMNESLDEDVVDFKPNYDAQLTEPEVLPAAFPNLLVNGSSGIAVGMATNMPPHNLREVIAAALHLLENPQASLDDLMRFCPGPDLPTGGVIVGLDGVRDAYESGRGSFRTRAKVSIESVGPRKMGLVVTALPYLVGPEKVIEKIKDGVNNKKIVGVSNVVDLTDRTNGLKLVIELKTGFDPQVVLDLLYKFTPMEDNFGINNVCLVNGRPETLGLKDLLGVYLAHRVTVTRRRSSNRLGKRENRLHLVEGLLVAIVAIDEVIQVIRTSEEVSDARTRLMQIFDLSAEQAEYILELRLRRLTKFSVIELEAERDQLLREIAELRNVLSSDVKLRALVANELSQVASEYGDDRRTQLIDSELVVQSLAAATKAAATAEVVDAPCTVIINGRGSIYRTSESHFVDPSGFQACIATSTRSDLGFVSSTGVVHRLHVSNIPGNGAEQPLEVFLGFSKSEKFVGVLDLNSDIPAAVGTRLGVVKRVQPEYPDRDEFEIISLKDGDEIVGVAHAVDDAELAFVADDAQVLIYSAALVRPQGRPAGGMAGISLDPEARVVAFGVINDADGFLVTVAGTSAALPGTDPGSLKVSALAEFPRKGRATSGVRGHKFLKGEDSILFSAVAASRYLLIDSTGKVVNREISPSKRDASGEKLGIDLRAVAVSFG